MTGLEVLERLHKELDHSLVTLAVHRALRHRRETLTTQAEFGQLCARIAELEHPRADG